MPSIMNKVLSFVFFALASAASTTRDSVDDVQASDIAPPLHPASDKKFFTEEYPDDKRPGVLHDFDVPHPLVQDSEDYDKDFVQDENSETGYWTVQMEYDALKNRLARERAEMNRAKAKMEEEKHDYEVISGKEADAERATQVLEEDAERAADAAADAKQEREDARAETKRQEVANAENVERKTKKVKECEDELRQAKEELNKVLEKLKVAEEEASKAADLADATEADVEQLEKDEAIWEERADAAEKNHKSLLAAYEEKLRQLKAMEKNLGDSAKILANFREPQMDSKGGVVSDKSEDKSGDHVAFHSAGWRAGPLASVAAAAVCIWAAR